MNWEKKGLIYSPSFDKKSWKYSSALTPTPVLLNEDVIRVYFSARDIEGIGRIGYVDLNSNNPSEVIGISENPVLDIGQPGCFDDNGVILGDIVKHNDRWRMYYVGFQIAQKVKFLAFSGIAESSDGGETFVRLSQTPILDRSPESTFLRAIHCSRFEDNLWKIWYSVGKKWIDINNVPYPNYYIKYLESKDGITFPQEGVPCISLEEGEYKVGRSRVYKNTNEYEMYYTIGRLDNSLLPGRATSPDGRNWLRADNTINIPCSLEGWDSKALGYLCQLKVREKTYMFYTGNNFGFDGFGYAILKTS
jgi:hypothetical protein